MVVYGILFGGMHPLDKLYIELTNHTMYVTCIAKCCHNMQAVTSLYRV